MQLKLKDIIKKIPRYSRDIFVIFYYKFLSLFFKDKAKFRGAWLICERGIEAKDNGYHFFKCLRDKHPELKAYYLIESKQTDDYNRIKSLENVVEYNSFEHKMAIFYASHFISTHIGFITPWSYKLYKILFAKRKKQIFVLLNHGITKEDMSQKLNKQLTGIDLFIAATQQDWQAIVLDKRYGYAKKDVALTGYARYDNWAEFSTKNQIVFMPTWRHYLVERSIYNKNCPKVVTHFTATKYFKHISSFLNNKELHKLLIDKNINLIFYPHYEMQSSLEYFKSNCEKIIFASKKTHNLPDLLKESLMMITDYSGVGFDFAYMYKPLVYYQFDREEYYTKHYPKGDFEMEKDGLGEVVTNETALLNVITKIFENNFAIENKYAERVKKMFTFHDNRNCERIYNAINNYKL